MVYLGETMPYSKNESFTHSFVAHSFVAEIDLICKETGSIVDQISLYYRVTYATDLFPDKSHEVLVKKRIEMLSNMLEFNPNNGQYYNNKYIYALIRRKEDRFSRDTLMMVRQNHIEDLPPGCVPLHHYEIVIGQFKSEYKYF